MTRNQTTWQLRNTLGPPVLRLQQQQLNRHVESGLDILPPHGDGEQRVPENETDQGAAVVRALWGIRRGVELNPLAMVDRVEEGKAMRAHLGPDRRLKRGTVGLADKRGRVDGRHE